MTGAGVPGPGAAGLDPASPAQASDRLARVVLEGESLTRLTPVQEADRAQAVADLQAENRFALRDGLGRGAGRRTGPFVLHLSIQEGRLVLDVRDASDQQIGALGLSLRPFRSLVKDYQLLVDSHIKAMEEGRADRIQAIDMGRRGLHNEGATLLRERLAGKIEVDFETARRLFTLVCVLHRRI